MPNQLLNNALIYADKAGWKIFPCKLDKTPYTKKGFKEATTDPEQIKKWWTKWPDASIGCACGPDSGIWVLDVDLPQGPESLKKLISENGELPETRLQQTGSGGFQYFFSWNGKNIRNSASKIGKDIDIRGLGGYCIIPPSPHPSGNEYKWLKRVDMPNSPEWLSDLIVKKPAIKHVIHPQQGGNSQYGLSALSQEIILLSCAGEHQRNDQLNRSSFALGQLVAGGELESGHVENSLIGIALSIGLDETESRKTFQSGFNSGLQTSRKAPENKQIDDKSYLYVPDENVSNVSGVSTESGVEQDVSNHVSKVEQNGISCKQNPISCKQESPNYAENTEESLMYLIEQFILNSSGSFHVRDIDNEFGLRTRKEKNARSRALNYMARKRKIINKDRGVAGKWHIISSDIEWVDLDAPVEELYGIDLPFGLHKHGTISPKSIIILAGTGDAGKTTFVLNLLRMNINKKYKKVYLMSEMGNGDYKQKIRRFGDPMDQWKKILAAQRSYDFNGVIEHHNKNGLTVIDYLEEVQGEYFKVTSQIRDIYDALGDGVAVIAIQKDSKAIFARGGEGTMEKSRLYLTIDYLLTVPKGIICAIKILKIKNFIGNNYKNFELHFKIHGKNEMTVLMDWTPSNQVDRSKCTIEYERGFDLPDSSMDEVDPIYFSAFDEKSKAFRVREETIVKWGANFTEIEDIYNEVLKLSVQHAKKRFIKNFVHLSTLMASINKKRGE